MTSSQNSTRRHGFRANLAARRNISLTFLGVQSRPSFALATSKRAAAVELAIPLEVDLSLDDYDDDDLGSDTVGAMSAGFALATTVPSHFGTWSFSATTRALHFGPRC